jgi:hypothetical protein
MVIIDEIIIKFIHSFNSFLSIPNLDKYLPNYMGALIIVPIHPYYSI